MLVGGLTMSAGAWAQKTFPVTDSKPVMINGLEMGFHVKKEEVKEVGNKGDFARYSVQFYVTNTTTELKIILYKQGFNLLGNTSDQLAQFNCLNATGARLTSKEAIISADPATVQALVDDKDCSGKTTQNKRFVRIGSWIKAGQTISTNAILITPLNEQPNMQVTYLADQLQPTASAPEGVVTEINRPAAFATFSGPFKIRNAQLNTYLNTQTGAPQCTAADPAWPSAVWELAPVQGGPGYTLRCSDGRTYLTTDNSSNGSPGLFVNYVSDGAHWLLEPGNTPYSFRIKNVSTGWYLCFISNTVKLAKNFNNVSTADWVLERP